MEYGFGILATHVEKYNFVIKIAQGNYRYSDIVEWLRKRVKK